MCAKMQLHPVVLETGKGEGQNRGSDISVKRIWSGMNILTYVCIYI